VLAPQSGSSIILYREIIDGRQLQLRPVWRLGIGSSWALVGIWWLVSSGTLIVVGFSGLL
jgi:hypothetical protein